MHPYFISVADVNGDTKPDLLAANFGGNGGSDTIVLDNSRGNPLLNRLHLNGTFTISGLSASNPLDNTTLEIGRSTVFISYSSSDPLSQIQGYLRSGYNNGAWNGTHTPSSGVITSTPARNNAAQTTAIGYADSADGLIPGQPANTIELKYTLYGDTGLGGSVGFNDFTRLTQHYGQTTGAAWDTGDFNYDTSVNSADFTLLTRTYNTSIGNQALPAVAAGSTASAGSTSSPQTASGQAGAPTASAKAPAVQVTPPPTPAHHLVAPKQHKKLFR